MHCICLRRPRGLRMAALLPWRAGAFAGNASPASLDVFTADGDNHADPGVQIQLQVNSAVVYSAETGPDGYAQFKDLEAGHYELVATKEGFESVRKSDLDLTAAGSISVDLILVPALTRRESVEVNGSATPLEQGDSSAGYFFGQRGRHFTADFDVLF